ncbi:MAG: hypothetical protein SOZ34_05445 [Clostridia bacterium]|nr:hypothetical protein [Clostridia bacterium]
MKGYKIVSADGTAVYYKMKTNSSYYKNSIVKATFENGYYINYYLEKTSKEPVYIAEIPVSLLHRALNYGKYIVFRYIFVYYNRIRIYTSNPYGLPPVKYRDWLNDCRKTAA